MYFSCCIYVLLLLNMPEMAHDWINKSILFYSILIKKLASFYVCGRKSDLKTVALLLCLSIHV